MSYAYWYAGGGGKARENSIKVTTVPGATVTISNTEIGKTYTQVVPESGQFVFEKLEYGTWNITYSLQGTEFNWDTVNIDRQHVSTSGPYIPPFTYTGTYELVDFDGYPISNWAGTKKYKIRFLTSGILTFTDPNRLDLNFDIFLVGGGGNGNNSAYERGGGGGGGYTTTQKGVGLLPNYNYSITIGGGASGYTKAFNLTAKYGKNGDGFYGGAGGSGGGEPGSTSTVNANGGNGGEGGYNGGNGGGRSGGKGQGTTTREFGDPDGTFYAGGGGGGGLEGIDSDNSRYYGIGQIGGSGGGGTGGTGIRIAGENGTPNTGGGGGGQGMYLSWGDNRSGNGGKGGSGIVIIRPAQ